MPNNLHLENSSISSATAVGGDVALEATGKLNHKVDNLITLATPVYEDVTGDAANIGTWINVFTFQDAVPSLVSTSRGEGENSATYQQNALNLELNAKGYGHFGGAHSAIYQDDSLRNLWWQFWQEHAQCHGWFDDNTNTVHGCI